MEPSAPLLTSAIAKAMRHESAQARKHAAAAAFRLLGDAPTAMKKSAALRGVGTTVRVGENILFPRFVDAIAVAPFLRQV